MRTTDVRRRAAGLVGDRARQHVDGPATRAKVTALRLVPPGHPIAARDTALVMVRLHIVRTAGNASNPDDCVEAAG